MKALIAATLAVVSALPAAAWDGSKAFQACVTAAGGGDPKMGDCARDELGRQDKALNAAYTARLKSAGAGLRRAIVVSQRAWVSYRDSTCRAEAALYEGGTMEPLAYTDCEVRLTIERLAWLKSLTS